MTSTTNSDNVIGSFTPHAFRITCKREPEVGIAWMACIEEMGIWALGGTPQKAATHLVDVLAKRGHTGQFQIFDKNCESLEKTGSTWRSAP